MMRETGCLANERGLPSSPAGGKAWPPELSTDGISCPGHAVEFREAPAHLEESRTMPCEEQH